MKDFWVPTYTGKRFYPLRPRVEDICITDIAHHLSLLCRYTGACCIHYSVAQHSMHVSELVPKEFALEGLLHDAAEAYLGDVNHNLKRLDNLAGYREIEADLQAAIWEAFGIEFSMEAHKAVSNVDTRIVIDEARELLHAGVADEVRRRSDYWDPIVEHQGGLGVEIFGLNPFYAKEGFLMRFDEIMKDRG